MRVGTVKQIWRYPVKSMAGEMLRRADAGPSGIPGDRGWAVRDEERGGIRGAKKIPGLMRLSARYPVPPQLGKAGPAEISFPDGSVVMSDDPAAAKRVSEALGRRVTLWPLQPADKLEHYRRGAPDHEDLEQELRSIFALQPDEPLPDLSFLPPEILEYESPPGTYFDAFPLLLLTDASLDRLQALAPDSKIDVRRFRPNFLIETPTDNDGFIEREWVGRSLRVGSITVSIASTCPRCVMTTLPFADLPHDPDIMRTLVREANQALGVYAAVTGAGRAAVGDPVELLP